MTVFGEPPPCCRFCGADLHDLVVDLGTSPLCQTVIAPAARPQGESVYPLRAWVCHRCWLLQVEDAVGPEQLFQRTYPYHSSYSDSWLAHARRYAERMIRHQGLDGTSRVVEVGSNDGYLLRWFAEAGIPVVGVDPATTVAAAAAARGIPTRVAFFGREEARAMVAEGLAADLVCGANVLAQVPDPGDFVAGLAQLVKPDGLVTLEFPHLLALIDGVAFDTIYHEHYSYFSLVTLQRIFARHGLTVVDVEELASHGGSLRVHARRGPAAPRPAVAALTARERARGVEGPAFYTGFGAAVRQTRRALLTFLFDAADQGRTVVGYGAPGKGNTLLNYCGIRADLLAYTVDRNPAKQGHYLPGSRIPVHSPARLAETRPDYILILPWNLRREIAAQLAYTAGWGCRLVVPIPRVRLLQPAPAGASAPYG